MTTNLVGVSRVWIGAISDPPQYLSLLARRIATLGGSYKRKYEMNFETVRQESRHVEFYGNNTNKKSIKRKQEENETLCLISSLLSSIKDSQNTRIVPKNCLSVLQHSKHNQSVFVMFDDHIISASNLLTTQFIDPFKLKKRTKAIYVKGECYEWGDFYIYFGQISLHKSPADFVVIEIEYKCMHSLHVGNSNRILQETFHFIVTPIPKVIVSSNIKTKTIQTELERSMDVDQNQNTATNQDEKQNETKDIFLELSNEKGEKIRWKSQPTVDFSRLDINPNCLFDGRHLAALYSRAFAQLSV